MADDLTNLESCSVAELVVLVRQLLHRIEALEAENARLKGQLRACGGAPAPFSYGKPNPDPKMPGRRAGEGRSEGRAMPVSGHVDREGDLHDPLRSPDFRRYVSSLDVLEQTTSVGDIVAQRVRSIRFFGVEHGSCAERGLLGLVIARGVSKNERGARTYESMKSVTATHALLGGSVVRGLGDRNRGMPAVAAVAR